jgi:hypothetical protein
VLCAGSFDEDVRSVARARSWTDAPAVMCAVAAGVREFQAAVEDPDGIYGIAQWLPGRSAAADVGPSEERFLEEYRRLAGSLPDYPAAQAAASAALAVHCVDVAGSVELPAVWKAAVGTRVRSLFGDFAVDARSGEQIGHRTILSVWNWGTLSRAES